MERVEPEKLDSSSKGILKGPMVITGLGLKQTSKRTPKPSKKERMGKLERTTKGMAEVSGL